MSCLVSCVWTGTKFENPEMFGQYPLQVNGFKDLHECLEAAMNEGEIESAENCSRSGQEVRGAGGPRPAAHMFSLFKHIETTWPDSPKEAEKP